MTCIRSIFEAEAVGRGVKSIVAKAESLPFKDGVFVGVLMLASLCYFEETKALLELASFEIGKRTIKGFYKVVVSLHQG